MTHLWVRAEQRDNEKRVGITPKGAAMLVKNGFKVTVEKSISRIIPIDGYVRAGCEIVNENSWPYAPNDAISSKYNFKSKSSSTVHTLF